MARLIVRLQDRIVAVLLGLTLLPLLAVSVVAIGTMTGRLESELKDQADRSVALVTTLIDQSQQELLAFGGILAGDPIFQADVSLGNIDDMAKRLQERRALYHADRIVIGDPEGRILIRSLSVAPGSDDRSGGSIKIPALFAQAAVGLELDGKTLFIVTTCPIVIPDGTLVGWLRMARPMNAAMLEQIHRISGAEVSLFVHGVLTMTTLPSPLAQPLGGRWSALSSAAAKTAGQSHPVVSRDLMVGGQGVAARLLPLLWSGDQLEAGLVVTLSRVPTQLAKSLISNTIFVIALVATVVVMLIGALLTRAITRPLGEMARATAAMARGDLRQRVPATGDDELSELARSFNKMATELQALMQNERELAAIRATAKAEKQKAEELQRYAAELAHSNAELQQFAYVASHDLQEPLRMVASYIQLLSRRYKGQLDQDADDFIKFAVDGVMRMQRLIQDLLAYSRVGHRDRPFAPVSCEQVFGQAIANLKVAIDESQAVITHDPLPTLTADPTQLAQLFQNLLGNAIKFRAKEPPRIHLSAVEQGPLWRFALRDNGIGLEPQYAERVFVIFQRLSRDYAGTGIGLAICKKIVERHGGHIWVESTLGHGATFFFTLAMRPPARSASDPPTPPDLVPPMA